ncbi:MAG: response regulator [Pseudomonadales bacterium]
MAATKKVLVVDDNLQIGSLIQRILDREGFDVTTVSTPQDALAWCEQNGLPDLLLSDVKMPQMSGPELSRQLKELHGDFAVVFMSGFPGDENEDIVPLLPKPFNREELIAAINAIL